MQTDHTIYKKWMGKNWGLELRVGKCSEPDIVDNTSSRGQRTKR